MTTYYDTDYYDTDTFLGAWMKGVAIAGIEWFGGAWSDKESPTKWDYRPDYDLIHGSLGTLSTGEAAFLAAMYSFYNPEEGNRMLRTLGCGSPGAVAVVMDEPRRRVIAALVISYEGW